MMDSGFIIFILASSFALHSSHTGITDKYDVVIVNENLLTTLSCTGTKLKGDMFINWTVKSAGMDEWKLIFSESEKKKFSGAAWKETIRLSDDTVQDTRDFSLLILPKVEDGGFYMCLIKQGERLLKEKIFLLAVLTVSFYPAAPVPQNSMLRLIGRVTPDTADTRITWTSPGGLPMKVEMKTNTGAVTKVPQVQKSDGGTYICTAYPLGKSAGSSSANVNVTVDADKEASFTSTDQGQMIHSGTTAHRRFPLTCPSIQGDFVQLYWIPQNPKRRSFMNLVYKYDRWRGSTQTERKNIQLAGLPFNAEGGSFSFLLTPELNDGGVYVCEVYLNDNVFIQNTTLSVLKVKTNNYSSKLELLCQYSEQSQVKGVAWEHHNKSRQLQSNSVVPGSISTTLPLPITPDVAGNYTCVLQLKNGQIIRAHKIITLPPKVSVSVTTPSLYSTTSSSLCALLLLVPLVAAAVSVLLWRQKHISDHGIERSMSVYSGEAENLYENPDDIRQASPQSSFYMDLKPRGDSDVYKELERYEQCQG